MLHSNHQDGYVAQQKWASLAISGHTNTGKIRLPSYGNTKGDASGLAGASAVANYTMANILVALCYTRRRRRPTARPKLAVFYAHASHFGNSIGESLNFLLCVGRSFSFLFNRAVHILQETRVCFQTRAQTFHVPQAKHVWIGKLMLIGRIKKLTNQYH
jgi:hypothetical protein